MEAQPNGSGLRTLPPGLALLRDHWPPRRRIVIIAAARRPAGRRAVQRSAAECLGPVQRGARGALQLQAGVPLREGRCQDDARTMSKRCESNGGRRERRAGEARVQTLP